MNINVPNIYFIGIGGIGMSALARYFKLHGKNVAGYDRTPSAVTQMLEDLGIVISFEDKNSHIPTEFSKQEDTLVIYTPAIKEGEILDFFNQNKFTLYKRAQVLGEIFNSLKGIAIAGTHGKTTTSAILAHIFEQSPLATASFVGGIMKNYNSNFISDENPKYVVAEADEFDRSFLQLNPHSATVTSVDADHLDIYENKEDIENTFKEFISKVDKKGTLFIAEGLNSGRRDIKQFSYGFDEFADYQAINIKATDKGYRFDLQMPNGEKWTGLHLGISGLINVKNAVAAIGLAHFYGIEETTIREALYSFEGIKRRFDIWHKGSITLVDDYAHHPKEIEALLKGLRDKYENKKLTAIFQPHLYTRTRDFADEFATILSNFDQIILLPIYPAREKPIKNVNSELIYNKITNTNKFLVEKKDLINFLKKQESLQVIVTIGAGDIDREIPSIYEWVKKIGN